MFFSHSLDIWHLTCLAHHGTFAYLLNIIIVGTRRDKHFEQLWPIVRSGIRGIQIPLICLQMFDLFLDLFWYVCMLVLEYSWNVKCLTSLSHHGTVAYSLNTMADQDSRWDQTRQAHWTNVIGCVLWHSWNTFLWYSCMCSIYFGKWFDRNSGFKTNSLPCHKS